MKILFIGHEPYLNGASKSMLNIIDTLRAKHKIYVLTSFQSGDFYEELIKRNVEILCYSFYRWCLKKENNVQWVKHKFRWYFYEKEINEITAKKVAKFAIEESIDIIHSNSSVINIGALIKKYSGIKHVWHIREFADLDFQMYPIISKKRYFRIMNQYTDRFICISNAVFNHYDLLDKRKKRVIYNGVDSSNLIEHTGNMKHSVNFLIAGRISKAKGQEYAIQACLKLIQKGINNFHLYIAGSGGLQEELPSQLTDFVSVLGLVKNMPELRKDMDVELVCSTAEAFGRVTAEAMMGGIPVIGSNTGGTVELVQDGVTGFLYDYNSVDNLAAKMQRMIKEVDLRDRMGRQAREYAEKHFRIERCVDEILNVYNLLLSSRESIVKK
ncbi:glycosyltransferase family 4 protein [Neobacillus sp. SuZ13]|uniref:glycosyltransferase family 4 protein n=1 Tax=Neobacillus sp. SuZ13 TaxID=3047875 RepID=UPI0024BF4144|nr:glycosyltransferase family 4 protein [Neobacillus sp. SuZ13]WHY66793.1 glycosyltransferase family 4 protein [Neobacillus sp. SuZ13]